jgi:hypothetical protein
MKIIDYSSVFDEAIVKTKESFSANNTTCKRKLDIFLSNETRDVVPGDMYLKQLQRHLAGFVGYQRSNAQIEFHEAMINACLPHIYGTYFEKYREKIMKERGITELQSEILICCPRRFGKTTSVSMFVACMLYVVPDTWISCFSTGQRASTTLLDQAARFYNTLPSAQDRILKKNTEQFFIRGSDMSDIRRFHSFPSSVAGLKGQGGKVVILEEASRLDEEVFTEVCLPLLGVNNTSLVAISTPLEENNFFSQLLAAKKPNGSSLFKNLQIQLICNKCRSEKKLDCPHNANNLPRWKSAARNDLVKELMSGNRDMWLREQAGVITTKDTSAFDRPSVEKAFADENRWGLMRFVPDDNTLFVSIDPAGGGFSQTAITAAGIDVNTKCFVLIGGDQCLVTNDDELERFLRQFFEKLRSFNLYANSNIILIIERNFGGSVTASRIANICMSFQPMRTLTGDTTSHHRVGVVTTETIKERARVDFQRFLRLETFVIIREPDFVTLEPKTANELKKQILNFKYVTETRGLKSRTILSGKGFSISDDLVMSLLLLVFWSAYSMVTPSALL